MLIVTSLVACSMLTNRGRPGWYDRFISTVCLSLVDSSCKNRIYHKKSEVQTTYFKHFLF